MSWNSTLDGYLFQIEENVKRQKEKAEDVINLVKECFAEADFDIPDAVLDRAHRIGPVYKNESDQDIQGIIVQSNNFRYRLMFYKNRKRLQRGKRVRINLTSNYYNLLKKKKYSNKMYENGEHCSYVCRRKLQTKSCE